MGHRFLLINLACVLTSAFPALPQENEITVALPGGATMEFVWIDPGTFFMGSAASELGSNEEPQHEVTISQGFYLGKYEMTQGQWEAVMNTTPWSDRGADQSNPNFPAAPLSWHDVLEFAARLNNAAGEAIFRLPTEAEWEYAARAGTTTHWSFGDDEDELGAHAWYWDNTLGIEQPYFREVGSKRPNPWGLHSHARPCMGVVSGLVWPLHRRQQDRSHRPVDGHSARRAQRPLLRPCRRRAFGRP